MSSVLLVDVERLGEVVIRALLHRRDGDALAAVRGEQHDGQRRIALDDLRHQLEPGHAGHREIGEDGVGLVELVECLRARARGQHAVPAIGEHLAQRVETGAVCCYHLATARTAGSP